MSAPSASSRFGLRLALVLLLLAGLAAAGWFLLRPVATVEAVVSGPAIDAKPGSVTVVEQYSMELRTDLPGRLVKKDFKLDPGETVATGQVLAQLDPTDLELALEKDEIDYDAAKARFATDHSTELSYESFKADVANFERLNRLGSYSNVDLAKRENELKIQEQRVALEKIDHQQTLDTYENTIKAERHRIDEMTLRAPFDAVVSAVYKHPGDIVGAGESIATLITTGKVVVGKISEEDFADIRRGQQASVMFIPYGNWIYNGTVDKIMPVADPLTQRHVIHLKVEIDPAKLVPGINGEVSVVVGKHQARAIVPRRAVFSLGGDNVFVVADGRVERRPVTRGYVWDKGVEITKGLEPGELVIVDGLEDFHEGERVRTREIPSDVITRVK